MMSNGYKASYKRIVFHATLFGLLLFGLGVIQIWFRPPLSVGLALGMSVAFISWLPAMWLFPLQEV